MFVCCQLRKLGAVYLHQSVCLLPERVEIRGRLRPVVSRVRSQGGHVRMLSIIDGPDQEALIEEQRQSRDIEYAEVVERAPQLLAELALETTRGRATYAEVESSEADLERFEKWLSVIADCDYFHALGGQAARDIIQECRDALSAFEAAAITADTTSITDKLVSTSSSETAGDTSAPLRIVEDLL